MSTHFVRVTDPLRFFRALEATEANLARAEDLWQRLQGLIPQGISFGAPPAYDKALFEYREAIASLPTIDGWRIEDHTLEYNAIAQWRVDAQDVGELDELVRVAEAVAQPGRDLLEYRMRLDRKRRKLIHEAVTGLMDTVDGLLVSAAPILDGVTDDANYRKPIPASLLEPLRETVEQIDTLLGSSVQRPSRWSDLRRHLRFAVLGDLSDIVALDWPEVRRGLLQGLNEGAPIPVEVDDLGELEAPNRATPIPHRLNWSALSPDDFERLLFSLIAGTPGYENPKWLTQANASDRGRDLSVTRVFHDGLSGPRREHVVIQCKHYQSRSVNVADIATLKAQMKLWNEPRVDVLVIATSGRFATDAVQLIETENAAGAGVYVDMWPESHLELLLAGRPALISQFGLR